MRRCGSRPSAASRLFLRLYPWRASRTRGTAKTIPPRRQERFSCGRWYQNLVLHFSPPDSRSTRYDRQDFAFPSRRLHAVLNVLFKYACSRLFPPPGLRLVLTALSCTSPRHVVRNAGQPGPDRCSARLPVGVDHRAEAVATARNADQFFLRPCADHSSGKRSDRCQRRLIRKMFHVRRFGTCRSHPRRGSRRDPASWEPCRSHLSSRTVLSSGRRQAHA